MRIAKCVVVFLFVLMSGCAAVSTVDRPDDYYGYSENDSADSSLFASAGSLLTDEDIERILNYRLRLPAENRIAVLQLSSESYWRYYDSDFVQLNESITTSFIGQIRKSARVYDASFLPSLLIPDERTVPYLRSAAARYQADLLLAYRSKCQNFSKYRLIDPHETKAYCTVEAVLLDVRTGIVPFTSVVTEEFSTVKVKSDLNFSETIKKAEMNALDYSLREVAYQLRVFLNKADTL